MTGWPGPACHRSLPIKSSPAAVPRIPAVRRAKVRRPPDSRPSATASEIGKTRPLADCPGRPLSGARFIRIDKRPLLNNFLCHLVLADFLGVATFSQENGQSISKLRSVEALSLRIAEYAVIEGLYIVFALKFENSDLLA